MDVEHGEQHTFIHINIANANKKSHLSLLHFIVWYFRAGNQFVSGSYRLYGCVHSSLRVNKAYF